MSGKGSSLYATGGGCVTLIGMAGAGKSTVGNRLAALLGWPQLDTDQLIEAHFGRPLQELADAFGRDRFVEVEDEIVSGLAVRRAVISTGGSVVYGKRCMDRLRELGPIVYLAPAREVILARVAANPDRGLAIAPGQTVEDLFNERLPLYEAAADFTVDSGRLGPDACAEAIRDWLNQREGEREA
ncbi:shikimate kinase [Desulfobaculum xiamenense]|uniref:Shikimate kinase n=1 Tax=Desulfobaculum xiamenense TaxID=995050 RepID=A0A846QJB2_9BACT|nr:homoserine kinase [Desulfobaculum xiamenense]NJB68241.1 shikimate kinase [Desulfobaculum xiamenense]